eukprot:CAMPEP_0195287160 /NCGR_PEP_ID=MMETSP0707-20130614/4337_1 /TAXON_ID=33640 /ORGANISM="Asterionellopsis glacialis, Strain CCMP134" /LENGTH=531 /DNA_ID=CAMNT_0040346889 /DNA_START=53 /DNA_END=1648 /DNA_ORIENTATION=-
MEIDPFFAVDSAVPAAAKPSVASAPVPTEEKSMGTGMGASAPSSKGASSNIAFAEKSAVTSSAAATQKVTSSTNLEGLSKAQPSLEEATEEIATLLESGKVTMREVSALQSMMRDHVALRDKVGKLKSLLGRSAKAQREAKMELETTQKRLDQALREVDRLSQKVERLQTRPTHMDLLADFETNFDRALLTVGQQNAGDEASEQQEQEQQKQQQTAPTAPTSISGMIDQDNAVVDGMLMQELAESKQRVEKLEGLNSALVHRSSSLEQEAKDYQKERDVAHDKLRRVELELRMAKMEAEHATRAVQDKMASLAEMQLEIDLVTKASVDANVRAAQGEEVAKTVMTDQQHVQELELQVQALQEWALASAESKALATDRVKFLENQIAMYQNAEKGQSGTVSSPREVGERSLLRKTSSLVIGAGDVGFTIMELQGQALALKENERIVLRWKFDITPSDMSIDFNILKGKCDDNMKRSRADYIIKKRTVAGGAGGETEMAFAVQNACTVLWSNTKSWIRPRTIKYELEAFAVVD